MLGKTAGGLFWMFRYLERSENTARLVDSGFRMALTR
ncbi:MAG: alpha-E domain-containing protein, partial [Pseudomonadota bacterium]